MDNEMLISYLNNRQLNSGNKQRFKELPQGKRTRLTSFVTPY